MEEKKNTRGGVRAGAGRKRKEIVRTEKIGFRATTEEKELYFSLIKNIKDKTGEEYIVIINNSLELYSKKIKEDK